VALAEVSLDTGAAARLDDLTLKRDCLDITFKSGTLFLAEPVEGVVSGAVFIGTGRIKVSLPDDIEREQLEKYTEKTELDESFTNAFFRFDDDTA